MSTSRGHYIGLSVSGHDPAFAIVGPEAICYLRRRAIPAGQAGLERDPGSVCAYRSGISRLCGAASEIIIAGSWHNPKPDVVASSDVESASEYAKVLSDSDALWLNGLQRRAFEATGAHLRAYLGLPADTAVRRYDHHLAHALTTGVSFANCGMRFVSSSMGKARSGLSASLICDSVGSPVAGCPGDPAVWGRSTPGRLTDVVSTGGRVRNGRSWGWRLSGSPTRA